MATHLVALSFSSNWSSPRICAARNLRSNKTYPRACSTNSQLDQLDKSFINHMENLKKVKSMLSQRNNQLETLITVDSLKRLGIDYHFNEEITAIIDSLHKNLNNISQRGDMFAASLSFRLLREAGYFVPSNMFDRFTDEKGDFKPCLCKDMRGMLSLHDSSYLNTGEDILYKANEFSRKHLKSSIRHLEPNLRTLVRDSLEHPYHMSLPSYKAKQYLSYLERSSQRIGAIEEIAIREFNLNQELHQKELKVLARWWKNFGLVQQLTYARDQLLKWYMWSMTIFQGPQLSEHRILLTKVIAFIYLIDDIFDVIGSPDELRIFTEVINKWENSTPESLPDYMRACYMALFNLTSEIAHLITKEHGLNPINSLKKSWVALCNAFMVEAKWFSAKYVPTTDDYLRNGHGITKETIDLIESNPAVISCTATILRLWDDLGSAKDENQEGFDGSYIECYMKENPHCSTHNAREHVMHLISKKWEELNKEYFTQRTFSPDFIGASLNFTRMVRVMYGYDQQQKLPMLEDYANLLLFAKM
uniref:(3S,6E)-nerolidol synthase 1-like n=1 Tax=Ananas comosus var. bracteatus TaxID=296719 RepID=A0A6V7QCF8_ANACO|nr:unnamed protein product [Ananas comosus var. bracteatus]